MERVAADQGAVIGLTYRCFGLAAECDPVMSRRGSEWSVVGGLASRVDLLRGSVCGLQQSGLVWSCTLAV